MKTVALTLTIFAILCATSSDALRSQDSTLVREDSTIIAKPVPIAVPFEVNRPVWTVEISETRELIAEDVGDFVALFPAITPLDHGSFGQASPLTFRGSTPQQAAVYFDDFDLADPIQGRPSSVTIPVNWIDKMTFYGAESLSPFTRPSLGGAFRVESSEISGQRPYSTVSFRSGSFGYSDLGAILSLPVNQSSRITFGGSNLAYDVPARDFNGSRIMGKISMEPRYNLKVGSATLITNQKVTLPLAVVPDFRPGLEKRVRDVNRVAQTLSLKLGDLARERKQWDARLAFSTLRQNSIGDTLAFNNRSLSLGAEVDRVWVTGKHLLTAGGQAKFHSLSSVALGGHSDAILSASVKDIFRLNAEWQLGSHLQIEKKNGYSGTLNGSFNLHFRPSAGRRFWLGFKKARRYPTFAERYWPTDFYNGRLDLAPESGLELVTGLHYQRHAGWSLHASAFLTQIDNWIGDVVEEGEFGTSVRPTNLGKRTVSGVDVKLALDYVRGGELGISGTYLHAWEAEFSKKQVQTPEIAVLGYADFGRSMFDRYVYVTLRLTGRFYSYRYGYVYKTPLSLTEFQKLPFAAVADAHLSLQFSDARMFVSMENLTSQKYELVPGFVVPALQTFAQSGVDARLYRVFRFGISWQFWD